MGGLYSKSEPSSTNTTPVFSSAFHSTAMGTSTHPRSEYNPTLANNYNRNIPPNISSNYGVIPTNRHERNNEEIKYRYLTENRNFQQRNISVSPNSLFKTQNYITNQSPMLINTSLNQNRQVSMPPHLSISKPGAESLAANGGLLQHSSSKMPSSGGSGSAYVHPGLYGASNSGTGNSNTGNSNTGSSGVSSKRSYLLQQPPNKRLRLSHDFNLPQGGGSSSNSSFIASVAAAAASLQQHHHVGTMVGLGGSSAASNVATGRAVSSSPGGYGRTEHLSAKAMSSGGHRQQQQQHMREPSYYPQVEAISPVPEDLRHGDMKIFTEKEDIGEKLRNVESEIRKLEQYVTGLVESQTQMSHKLTSANLQTKEEESGYTPCPRDPIQSIIADNHRRAHEQHSRFQTLCGSHVSWSPLALPLYRQPADLDSLTRLNRHFQGSFKPLLIKYIRRRKLAEKARLQLLADNYEVAAKSWYKRMEKSQNSLKRRQKDVKYRDLFEKIFPEIRRNREERDRDINDFNDPGNFQFDSCGNGANTRSSLNVVAFHDASGSQQQQQRATSPYDPVKETARMREYAIDPPVTIAAWNRRYQLQLNCCVAGPVRDAKTKQNNFQDYKSAWSIEEMAIFRDQYITTPKNFARIAACLPKKETADCIQYYYLTKKNNKYKSLVKKNARRRRANAERQRYRAETDTAHAAAVGSGSMPPASSSASAAAAAAASIVAGFASSFGLSEESSQHATASSTICANTTEAALWPDESDKGKPKPDQQKDSVVVYNKGRVGSNSCGGAARNNPGRKDDSDSGGDDGSGGCHSGNGGTSSGDHQDSAKSTSNNATSEGDKQQSSSSTQKSSTDSKNHGENQSHRSSHSKSESTNSDPIHIKDAIDFSIEQSLSLMSEEEESTQTTALVYPLASPGDPSIGVSLIGALGANKGVSASNDADVSGESMLSRGNSLNRAILMKDFCTAQLMNSQTLTSSSNGLNPAGLGRSSRFSPDKSRCILPGDLPSLERSPHKAPVSDNLVNVNFASSHTNTLSPVGCSKKTSDLFIDRVSRLYEEEVELFTSGGPQQHSQLPLGGDFRTRSDTQRTRSSSEAAIMYAVIKDRKKQLQQSSSASPSTAAVTAAASIPENQTVSSGIVVWSGQPAPAEETWSTMPPPPSEHTNLDQRGAGFLSNGTGVGGSSSSRHHALQTSPHKHHISISGKPIQQIHHHPVYDINNNHQSPHNHNKSSPRKIVTVENIINSLSTGSDSMALTFVNHSNNNVTPFCSADKVSAAAVIGKQNGLPEGVLQPSLGAQNLIFSSAVDGVAGLSPKLRVHTHLSRGLLALSQQQQQSQLQKNTDRVESLLVAGSPEFVSTGQLMIDLDN